MFRYQCLRYQKLFFSLKKRMKPYFRKEFITTDFYLFSPGTCGSSQFKCNSSLCIDGSLVCNIYSECGDDSDETGCTGKIVFLRPR